MTENKYMDLKDIAKEIRKNLKTEFPKCTFSVRIERYSMGQSLTMSLMKTPFEVFTEDRDTAGNIQNKEYAQLNQYQFSGEFNEGISNGTYLTREAWDVLKKASEIGNARNWDNSDPQTDYFDVNYYFNIHIGQWDKPFSVTGKPAEGATLVIA